MSAQDDGGKMHAGSGRRGQLYFAYDRDSASADSLASEFRSVWKRIHELMDVRDGNACQVAELVFTRPNGPSPVIAYRFTSDWAVLQYHHELVRLGPGLERGVFDMLGDTDVWTRKRVFAKPRNEDADGAAVPAIRA